jgi:hypothetical protein
MKHAPILLASLVSLATALPAAQLAPVQGVEGQASEVQAGPRRQSIQPAPLAGLWALSLSADLSWTSTQDLLSFYPPGTLSAPPASAAPGFNLGLRRFVSDSFYVGAQLSSLPKNYSVSVGADQDTWTLDSLLLGAEGGWLLYRAVSVAFYGEASVGWLMLVNGDFERSGADTDKGSLEGGALSEQFSLGALWFILPSVALEAQGGYRFGRVPVTVDSSIGRWTPKNGPDFYADFSGSFARLGLSFFWGLSNPWGEQEAPSAPPPPDGGT